MTNEVHQVITPVNYTAQHVIGHYAAFISSEARSPYTIINSSYNYSWSPFLKRLSITVSTVSQKASTKIILCTYDSCCYTYAWY